MTPQEIETAKTLLEDHAYRLDVSGIERIGLCLTAYWTDGGEKSFHELLAVQEHLACRSRESKPTADRVDAADKQLDIARERLASGDTENAAWALVRAHQLLSAQPEAKS